MCQGVQSVDLKNKPNRFGFHCPECCPWYYQSRKGYKYWLIVVYGDLEPGLVGPYRTEAKRDKEAFTLQKESDENGVYWMDTAKNKAPDIGSYSGGFMSMGEKEEA
jgi:hypothetical protein